MNKTPSKEYAVNKIAAALVPNLGHFKVVAENSDLIIEKIKSIEISLNSDTIDDDTRSSLQHEYEMLAQALNWMGVSWR